MQPWPFEGRSGTAAGAPAFDLGDSAKTGRPYTGVVLIHGIGSEKKNDTLQEVLNALAYWLNHVAKLSLRPSGPDRIWIETNLLEVDNPDTAASTATVELCGRSMAPGEVSTLLLHLREVWWAQAFGLPSARAALQWARVQFRQETYNILLPIRERLTVPARALPQVRRARRPSSADAGNDPAKSFSSRTGPPPRRSLALPVRVLLYTLLSIYDFIQDIWKSLQWLLGIPLVLLLLWFAGGVRILAPVPGFRALLRGVSALIETVSLHWIASMQVFLLDYTYAANIRERFQRQLRPFLEDDLCQRIVVIAHSMGTVVAYEGLTTELAATDPRSASKDITFICLAQALRRIWPLTRTDAHRLRGILPPNVRWIHFWARYDPVAAGDLNPGALPRLRDWSDPDEAIPDNTITETLKRVENVRVVNHDSIFSDHVSYWENGEQVIGPIAFELVRGVPSLEERVQNHLATADGVLVRRWRIAWRASVSMLAGVFVGLLAVYLGLPKARLGHFILYELGLLLSTIPPLSKIFSQLGDLLGKAQMGQNPLETTIVLIHRILDRVGPVADGLLTVVIILLLVAIVVAIVRDLLPIPTPFVFRGPRDMPMRVTPVTPKVASTDRTPQPIMPRVSPTHGDATFDPDAESGQSPQ